MKQLDYLLAKSKENSIKNKMNEDAKNQQFYRSENENFYHNNNNNPNEEENLIVNQNK